MKNALIDPRISVDAITGWDTSTKPITPVYSQIPNSARVAEVAATTFPVGDPLFWVPCDDNAVADQWYYDTVNQTVLVVPPAPPKPVAEDQPVASGVQTL